MNVVQPIIGVIAAGSATEAPAPVSCLYPLDDDGTLAAAFSMVYAGPAVGENQQTMDYTAASTTGTTAVLTSANIFTTGRFSRPDSSFAVVEGQVMVKTNPTVDRVAMILRTSAADILGTWTGGKTVCGESL